MASAGGVARRSSTNANRQHGSSRRTSSTSSGRRRRSRTSSSTRVGRAEGLHDASVTKTRKLELDINWTSDLAKKTNVLYLDREFELGPQFQVNKLHVVTEGFLDVATSFLIIHQLDVKQVPPLTAQVSLVRLNGDDSGQEYVMRRIKRPLGGQASRRSVRKLLHPFMPRVWIVFVSKSSVYTVEEYMPRYNLTSYLSGNNTDGILSLYSAELLKLLKHAHENSIVLRDLAPNKLLMTRTGHVRVIDFRFQWSVMEHFGFKDRDPHDITSFTAPEVRFKRMPATKASDMWSLGATLLTLKTGEDVFKDAKTTRHVEDLVRLALAHPPNGIRLSSGFNDLLTNLLVSDPAARMSARSALKHSFVTKIDSTEVNNRTWQLRNLEEKQAEPVMTIKSITQRAVSVTDTVVNPANALRITVPNVAAMPHDDDDTVMRRRQRRRSRDQTNSSMAVGAVGGGPERQSSYRAMMRAVIAQEQADAEMVGRLENEKGGEVEVLSALSRQRNLAVPLPSNDDIPDIKTGEQPTDEQLEQMGALEVKTVLDGGAVFSKAKALNRFDFYREAILGQGSFGTVYLVSINGAKEERRFALKEISKKELARQLHSGDEEFVMQSLMGQSFVRIYHSFSDRVYLYLVLQFCEAGSLAGAMRRYLEQIVLALHQMHSKSIVHRDLKPENILLTHDGYIRLCDFGLSRRAEDDEANSFVGSPPYMSPEMVRTNGNGQIYGRSVDAWSLGVIAYEMMVGSRPFQGNTVGELFRDIRDKDLSECLKRITNDIARDFVRQLLQRDPRDRLGTGSRIIDHEFFSLTNWKDVILRRIPPPYDPGLKEGQYDTSFFNS